MISKVVTTSVITPDLTDHLASTISVSLDANFHNSRWYEIGCINSDQNKGKYCIYNEGKSQKFHELIT